MSGPRPRRAVVSGLGFVTSIGADAATVEESLLALRHGIEPFQFLPGCDLPVKVAGTVKGFDASSRNYAAWKWPARYSFPREVLRAVPPHGLYALAAAEQAIGDGRLGREDLRSEATGLFTASAGSPFLQRHVLNQLHETGGRRMAPFGIVSTISGTLNFNLGAHFGIRGAVCGFVSACASTAHALGYAMDEIALGRLDRILVVGAEDLTADSTYSFHGMHALSCNPDPASASRPFDVGRDGFVGTGGAAALLVEDADAARCRDAPIYAEIAGWGQSADGFDIAGPIPDGSGLVLAMRRALHSAGLGVQDIGYVNAHATSTVAGDRSEARALRAVFGAGGARPAVSSTKALTGHALSMASAMEAGFCCLALAHGFIPGQAHLSVVDPECEGLFLPKETLRSNPGVILKNSSGFGGSNVSLVLRRWED